MSAGNACAAIGLANTNKIPMIGGYDQGNTPKFGADGPHIGVIGDQYWNNNWLGELVEPPFLVPATSGVAAGKTAQWVTTGGAPVTVGVAGKVDVALGVITSNVAGLSQILVAPGTVIPAGSYLWAFLV